MIEYATRPLTETERTLLEQPLPDRAEQTGPTLWALAGGAMFGGLTGALCGALLRARGASPGVVTALILLGVAAGIAAAWDGRRREVERVSRWREREQVRREVLLARGEVDVLRVNADAVVRLEDPDDGWCAGYFFQVAPRTVLFIPDACGPEDENWPCRGFDYTRNVGNGAELLELVVCSGEPLAPSYTLGIEDIEGGYIPEDGEIITASLDTLVADLKRLGEAAP
jgi:hypothetical protein